MRFGEEDEEEKKRKREKIKTFLYPRFIFTAFAAKKRIEELSAPDQPRSHHPRGMEENGDKKTAHKRTISEPPKKKVRG